MKDRKALRDLLTYLFPDPRVARLLGRDAGLSLKTLDLAGSGELVWDAILEEAEAQGATALQRILEEALERYPRQLALGEALEALRTLPPPAQGHAPTAASLPHLPPRGSGPVPSMKAAELEAPFQYHAFLSYRNSAPDKAFARNMWRELTAADFKIALDERDFLLGSPVLTEMERCIVASRFTLAVVSPRYLLDGRSEEEAIICKVLGLEERRRRLIPLILEPTALPLWMAHLTPLDFAEADPMEPPLEKLCRLLRTAGGE